MLSPGLCESLRRLLLRDPAPIVVPLVPFVTAVIGGCLKPGGGLLELSDGEGEDWEDFAPLTEVCTIGGGGRFIFCGAGSGLAETAVAITVVLIR